jgi:hypothetical protein
MNASPPARKHQHENNLQENIMKASPQKRVSSAKPKPKVAASSTRKVRKHGVRTVEGEGSYSATRDYNRHLTRDLKSRNVGKSAAKAQRALETDEAIALREAEEMGKRGPKPEPEAEDQVPISDPLR